MACFASASSNNSFVMKRKLQEQATKIPGDKVQEYLAKEKAVRAWIQAVLSVNLGEDLYAALKNGIVLCYLMQTLEPSTIPYVHDTPDLPAFRLRENISFFLAAVEDIGLEQWYRFTEKDLYEHACFPQVVQCLVALAKFEEKKGCPHMLPPLAIDKDSKLTGPQLHALRMQLVHLKQEPVKGRGMKVKISDVVIRKQLALYAGGEGKVKMETLERGYTRFQAVWRGHKARKYLKKLVRDSAYRKRVANELLQTEVDYVDSLERCIQVYLVPFEKNAVPMKVVTEQQVRDIFSDIRIIHQVNSELLVGLRPVIKNWSHNTCLGKTFKNMVAIFNLYSMYVSHLDAGMALVEYLKVKQDSFATFLEQCRTCPQNPNGMDIQAYLIQPVQRIPRYSLLLTDLLKHTWPEHPDFEELKDVNVKVHDMAMLLNERKREAENNSVLISIDAQLSSKPKDFRLIDPTRHLVKDLQVLYKKKNFRLYLFSDIVMWVAHDGKRLKYKGHALIKLLSFEKSTEKPDHYVLRQLGAKKPLLVVRCPAPTTGEWISAFNAAVADWKARDAAPAKVDDLQRKPNEEPTPTVAPEIALRERFSKNRRNTVSGTVYHRMMSENDRKIEELTAQKKLLESQLVDADLTLSNKEKKKHKDTITRAQGLKIKLQLDLETVNEQLAGLQQKPQAPIRAGSPSPATCSSTVLIHTVSAPTSPTSPPIVPLHKKISCPAVATGCSDKTTDRKSKS
eukprot:TRINITY_DN18058_c0_g1_i1.p1 TRINITY_DN18058_c0_g1~~TRINITY_DN18058_c0_g1_i1.p1  ORF type:complete len:762 (-),score=221.75 TRINITY_DN18058_c0_g1_i1:78-2282(-)